MLATRAPALTQEALRRLEGESAEDSEMPQCLAAAGSSRSAICAAGSAWLPSWRELASGKATLSDVGGDSEDNADSDPGEWRRGWQRLLSSFVETTFREREIMPAMEPSRQALLRSQSGPGAAAWLATRPTERALTLRPVRMQVALRRRLRWPLPLCAAQCNGRACRKALDRLGDHRAACPLSGRLKRRSRPLERIWARIFREAGARVVEDVFLRNTSLPGIHEHDGRRVEILATGLPLHRGVPLAVDATLVSPLRTDGRPCPRAAAEDGVAIRRGEKAKETAYPELVRSDTVRLVTLACEVGGRMSAACAATLRQLAAARARESPAPVRSAAGAAWALRWTRLLSVTMHDCTAATLVDDVPIDLDGADSVLPLDVGVWLDGSSL